MITSKYFTKEDYIDSGVIPPVPSPPEHYINVGYVDTGYDTPQLSSSDPYPDYIRAEVDETIDEIQKHQNADSVTFAFITDIHYSGFYNQEIRMDRMLNSYKEISKRAYIDKLILGGDYTNEGNKDYKIWSYRELRAKLDGIDYYPINGNHDANTIWDSVFIKADKSINHVTNAELYNLFFNHVPHLGGEFDRNNKELYYLINDDVTKTRYICIDSSNAPESYNENGKLITRGTQMMSQKQIDWLINEALKFDEDGWSVAVFTHTIVKPENEAKDDDRMKRMVVLNKVMDAFKMGESYSYHDDDEKGRTIHVDVDFADYTKADVIGFFVGDYHADEIHYSKAGIPYVLTGNALMYFQPDKYYVRRKDGDKSELLYDIMTVDKRERKVYITRVGAGEDRVVEY